LGGVRIVAVFFAAVMRRQFMSVHSQFSAVKTVAPNFLAGAICALMTLAYASGFATLIFGGSLAAYSGQAVLAAIVSSCVAILVLSWRSSFDFAMGGPDSNPSAILAVTVAAVAAEILHESGKGSAELLPTVLMFLFISSIGCGLLLYLIGERRWGRYVRYIPHQVVGGFLVGTGFLLASGGWKMLTGASPAHTTLAAVEAVPTLSWVTAGAVMIALLVLMRTWKHYLVIPGVIFGGTLLFHAVLAAKGIDMAHAHAAGLLMNPIQLGVWGHPFNQPWGLVRWDLILLHANDFAAMTMVVVITILLNATSLDHATGKDADFDRELKALGIANVLGGIVGGIVAVNSFNRSLLNLRAGASSPWAGRLCVAFVLLLVLFAPGLIALLAKPVLTGLILYLGVSLLIHWLWDCRREMPKSDYLTMLAILAIVAGFGIVPGVIFGVIIAMLSFVVTFSRASVVKHRFDGTVRHSNVERPPHEMDWLRAHGEHIQGASFHGYLFFGTVTAVLDELREVPGKARVLVLDFWLVRGIDASSVMVMRKLLKMCIAGGTQVVFTGMSAELREKMRVCGFDVVRSPARIFPDLDHGLEWSEQTILTEAIASTSLSKILGGLSAAETAAVSRFFREETVPEGETFIRRGDASETFYLILEGRVSIQLPIKNSDYRKRLRTYGPGTIVGEMGFYSGSARSADICTDTAARMLVINRQDFNQLEAEQPALAGKLHRLVVNTLASRLRTANDALSDLL
jgi:SulP family sulfate permease